ncbi:MAG: asparaginase [Candidatus Eremiobacteraeota bacterium]|nr:asparaginase [Candidatus Eremiobacteraeota bacterium]
MNEPFVEITRGPIVESAHVVSACAVDRKGNPILHIGDIETPVYLRSSAKPFIAAASVRAGVVERFGLEPREVAIMAASHSGEPFHIEAVRSILRKIGLTESALQCGPHPPYNAAAAAELTRRGEPFSAIHNNCSGKHAGILALCVLLDCDPSTYVELDNAAEQEILAFCARMTGDAVADFPIGVDGCGIPVFAASPLHGARAFMRLATLEEIDPDDARALGRVRDAMLAYPLYVAGTGEFDSVLMTALDGAIASKGGAEGVHGDALISEGVGILVKVCDGARRAVAPTVLAMLKELDAIGLEAQSALEPFAAPPIRNRAGREVGETRVKRAIISKPRSR